MSERKLENLPLEATPVDDVRAVREMLSSQFGNDVNKLMDHAQKVLESYHNKLGLKRADQGSIFTPKGPCK